MTLLFYIIVGVVFVGVFTLEVIAPASKNECDKRWLVMAIVVSVLQSVCAITAGVIFDELFQGLALFSFRDYPVAVQGLSGFLLFSFLGYWWHRAMHKSDFLWRKVHQLHHSPRRVESLTSFYLHPFDALAGTIINSAGCYLILGLDATGAAVSLLSLALYSIYVHADLKTPRWLGFVFQRPEMHRVHHKHMHHDQNYGLACWDMLFGTFANPKEYVQEVGFDEAREKKIYQMLKGQDLYRKSSNGN